MTAAAIRVLDLLVFYAIPLGLLLVCWMLTAAWVYVLARVARQSPLRSDLEQRICAKQQLPSGVDLKLSFGYVAFALIGDNCVQATTLYRLSRWLVLHELSAPARVVHSLSKLLTHADISPYAEIGPGFYLYHGIGTVIGKGTRVGKRAVVCQNVTTGGGATVGDDVKLWAGAKVIGRVSVGDRSEIGANGVVVRDVPADVVAVGVPATRFIGKTPSMRLSASA